ncbi:MAG: hypothetical protein IPQ07_44535 [Myxococcales bacterium]|nr:hypothetical protein [Myxococcales bacterium]
MALPLMGTNGASLTYTSTTITQTDVRLAARYEARSMRRCSLDRGLRLAPPGTLLRDADGKPKPNGLYRVPFTAIVPQCALTSSTPVPILIYGHGLLGTSGQVGSGPRIATESCMVAIGTDMRGMSDIDVPNVVTALNDANKGGLIFDVLVQGMINHVALVQIARGPMASVLFTQGRRWLARGSDPRVYYYGISQGGSRAPRCAASIR